MGKPIPIPKLRELAQKRATSTPLSLAVEVFAAALSILALPTSNAFMERTFSACTWHDDPLRQSLREERYEKKDVLAVNANFRFRNRGKN
eukprot:scaffold16320_cov131-Skeletonema_dohrnii-CCMP3373.AAC.2